MGRPRTKTRTRKSLETLSLAIHQELKDLEWQIYYPYQMADNLWEYPLPVFFKVYDDRVKTLCKQAPDLEQKINARARLDKIKNRTEELYPDLLNHLEESARKNIKKTDRYTVEVTDIIKRSENVDYEYQLYVFNMRTLYKKLAAMGSRDLAKELKSKVEKLHNLMNK